METPTALSDTTADADAMVVTLLRQTPVWRKLQLMGELNSMTRSLVLASIRHQQPGVSYVELHRQLADRLLGKELATAVYGDDVPPAEENNGL